MREIIGNRKAKRQAGYTIVELMLAVAIIMILAALAIPGYQRMAQYMRISGDMRNLNGVVAQAKMRAAADFTRARAYADLAANTYHLEVWNKAGNSGAGCWQTDGDVTHACTAGTSPVQPLSLGVSFGFSGLGTGSPNPQTTIQQAAACKDSSGGDIASTACIVFNSRGIPIDPATLAPISGARDAFYITDTRSVWGLTVRAPGMVQIWSSPASTTSWIRR